MSMLCLVVVLVSLLSGSAWAAAGADRPVVRIGGSDEHVPLLPRTVLLDPENVLTPSEALAGLAGPRAEEITGTRSWGFSPATLWSRVSLQVDPAAAGDWYFALQLPNFDHLQVYVLPDTGGPPVPVFTLGDREPQATEIRTRFHLAKLDLPAGRTDLLLKGRTNSTLTLDVRLWKLAPLLLAEQDFLALQSIYAGTGLILILAALYLFFYTRQVIYLVYVLNITANWTLWLMVNGVGPGYLWPGLARHVPIELHAVLALSILCTYAFSAMFLSTTRVPKIVPRLLWIGAWIGGLLMVLCLALPESMALWSNMVVGHIVMPLSIGLLFPTAIALLVGEPAARPLMIAWVALNLAALAAVARNLGLVPSNSWTLDGPQLGSVVEAIVFAYMLIARWGRMQRETEAMQRAALDAARRQEAILERRVADRTQELDAALDRERAARRLQQQFVAMVSHEFRTPLSVIDASARNIAVAEPRTAGRVGNIHLAVRRLIRMIDTCLLDERAESGSIRLKPVTFDLRDLVGEVVDAMRTAAPDRRIELGLPGEPVMVEGDPQLMDTAVSNLVENAVKYSPAGAEVRVDVTEAEVEAEVVVRDRGPGVAEADRERIFKKYVRVGTDAGVAGGGLGLYLTRLIVDAHGGRVVCEPALGEGEVGGRFVLRVPLEAPAVYMASPV